MDWDNIEYIFQIPVSWYEDVDAKLNKAYGNNLVYVKEGIHGGLEVGIDYEAFNDAVKQIASETSSGTVSKVDGVPPDSTGNVNFGLPSDKWMKTDGNGHINTTDEEPVAVSPLSSGFLYNDYGELKYKDYGTSADTVAEGNHVHGNITNDGRISGCIGTSCLLVTDTAGNITHSDGILSEQSWAGSDLATLSNLVAAFDWDQNTGMPKVYNISSVDGVAPNSSGNIELKAVRRIAGQADPDSDGLVTLTGFVKSVNNISPGPDGNVSVDVGGNVKTVDNIQPDSNGNVALTGYVKSVNNIQPGVNGNVTLDIPQTYVKSVDGLTGDVTLQGSYADFIHTHTHDDITDWDEATASFVDTLDVASKGVTAGLDWDDPDMYVCPTNHGHRSSDIVDLQTNGLSGVVKLSGDQIVNGKKTFTDEIAVFKNDRRSSLSENAVTIGGSSILTFPDDVNYYLDNAPNVPKTNLSSQVIATCGYINTSLSGFVTLDTEQEISAIKTFKSGARAPSGSGFFITTSNGSLIGGMRDNSGALGVEASAGKDLVLGTSQANGAKLAVQPTDTSKTSFAVATCGYVQSQLSAATGNVKTVQNVAPGDDGNIDLTDVFAEKDHTHTTDDITDWDEATQLFVETTDVETDGVVVDGTTPHEKYVCPTMHKHTVAAIEGAVKTVDGHQADENGDVSFGLGAGKYVKTDSSGRLSTVDNDLVEVPEGYTPTTMTSPVKVVTNVTWNGTQIVIESKNMLFKNGLLVQMTNNANTTINTVTYTP